MSDDRAVLSVASNETANVDKFFDKAVKGVEKVKSVINEFGKSGNIVEQMYGSEKQAQETYALQEKLEKQLKTKTEIVDRLTNKMKEYWKVGDEKRWELTRNRVSQVTQEIEKLNESLEEGSRIQPYPNVPDQGNMDDYANERLGIGGHLQGVSNIARQLGGGGENPFGDTIDQISGITDAFSQFDQNLGGFLGKVTEGAKIGAEGKKGMAAFFGSMKGGVSGLGNAAEGAIAAIGPAGIAVGALAIGAGVLNAVMVEQNKQTQKEIDLRRQNVDKELDYQDLISNGTSEQLATSKKQLEAELKAKTAARDAALQAEVSSTTLQSGVDKWRTVMELGLNRLAGRADELTTIYGTQIDDAREYNKELTETKNKLDNIAKAEALVAAREEEEHALETLAQAEEDHIQNLKSMGEAYDNYQKEVKAFKDSEEASYKRQLEDQAITEKREKKAHDEEMLKMENDFNDSIEAAKLESNKTLKSLETERMKADEDAKKALVESFQEIQKDLDKTRAANEKDFNESEDEARKDHNEAVMKEDTRFEKERIKRLNDSGKALLQAELDNDVNAYIAAQQTAKDEEEQAQQDRDDARKEDELDFQSQRQKSKESFVKQQEQAEEQAREARQQLQESYDKEKSLRQTQYDESVEAEKVALKERLQEEKNSYKESYDAAIAAHDKQQALDKEDRDLTERRRKEDIKNRLDEMQKSFEEQQAQVQKNDDAIIELIRSGGHELKQTYEQREKAVRDVVAASYGTLISQLKSMQSSMLWSSSGKSGGSVGPSSLEGTPSYYNKKSSLPTTSFKFGQRAVLAAEGTIVGPHKPTLVIAGEGDKQELVMPLDKSKGIPDGLMNNGPQKVEVHYNGNITIGDGVSEAVFREEMETLAEGLFEGWGNATNPGGASK